MSDGEKDFEVDFYRALNEIKGIAADGGSSQGGTRCS